MSPCSEVGNWRNGKNFGFATLVCRGFQTPLLHSLHPSLKFKFHSLIIQFLKEVPVTWTLHGALLYPSSVAVVIFLVLIQSFPR